MGLCLYIYFYVLPIEILVHATYYDFYGFAIPEKGWLPLSEKYLHVNLNFQTYSHNQYSFDPLDFGSVLSADVIKAKFKLGDVILEGLCLPERQRNQCRDINR